MTTDFLPPELALDEELPGHFAEWLDGEGDYDEGDFAEWLDNDQRAEWALRALGRAQGRILAAHAQADTWIRRITEWRDTITETDVGRVARLTEQLERYGLARRERTGTATLYLPSGTVATRREKEPKVEIVDPKAVLVWAKNAGATCVKTVEEVLVSQLRPLVKVVSLDHDEDEIGGRVVVDANGEIVPGVAIVDPATTASVVAYQPE